MHLTRLEAAAALGIFFSHISSISFSPAPPDCLAFVDTCMSHLCERERAFRSDICDDEEGCQTKGPDVCNTTVQSVLDRFPSLRGCACSWQEELCDSMQALAARCQRKPVYDKAGSCLDQVAVCIGDAVCNRYLAPVLQACAADRCSRGRCQQATRRFFGSMPRNVAEMLAMCECEASDQSCVDVRTALQSGGCGEQSQACQRTVEQCAQDARCRGALKTFQDKCWRPEEAKCSDSELQNVQCVALMDPGAVLGADPECQQAFLATLGTALHYPCSCKGVHSSDSVTCSRIQDVLHNRSHFKTSWRSTSGSSTRPELNESEQSETWAADYLMYAVATVLLVGVVILIPLAVVRKIWMFRRTDKARFRPVQKSNCVLIL